MVELAVSDNGEGVPAPLREKIFERFFRVDTSRTTSGNGLGLSIVAAVADLHTGRVFAEDDNPGLRIGMSISRYDFHWNECRILTVDGTLPCERIRMSALGQEADIQVRSIGYFRQDYGFVPVFRGGPSRRWARWLIAQKQLRSAGEFRGQHAITDTIDLQAACSAAVDAALSARGRFPVGGASFSVNLRVR